MRVPIVTNSSTTTTPPPAPFPGTLINASHETRLVQNRTSKIILQSLLGVVVLLSALACFLTNLHSVVLHNPCCIAGMASLFAGSELCDPETEICRSLMVPGAEWMSENELKEVWHGVKFQLAWWGDRYGVEAVRYKTM